MTPREAAIKKVIAYADSTHKPHWKVYYGFEAKTSGVAISSEVIPTTGGGLDKTSSLTHLQKGLELLPPGDFVIQMKDKPEDTGRILQLRFVLPDEIAGIGSAYAPQIQVQNAVGMVSREQVEAMLKEQEARLNYQHDKKDFERQLADLKKEMKQGGKGELTALMREVKEIAIGLGFAKNKPTTQVAIAGINAEPVPGTDAKKTGPTPEQIKLAEAYNAVYKQTIKEMFDREGSNEEGIVMLFCLNEWIKENKSMYATIKPSLDKYKDKLDGLGIITNTE